MALGQVSFRFDPATISWLKAKAEEEGRTLSNMVQYIVRQYISTTSKKLVVRKASNGSKVKGDL